MADQDSTPSASDPRATLEKRVQQLVMLSIGLKFEEKDELIKKLPSLSMKQLSQLREVFEEENKRKESLLGDFFAQHPELYPEFERFSKEHVSHIYQNVEKDEQVAEKQEIQTLLKTSF